MCRSLSVGVRVQKRNGRDCAALKRLEDGGYSVADRGHMYAFAHPPRADRWSSQPLLPIGFMPMYVTSDDNNDGD